MAWLKWIPGRQGIIRWHHETEWDYCLTNRILMDRPVIELWYCLHRLVILQFWNCISSNRLPLNDIRWCFQWHSLGLVSFISMWLIPIQFTKWIELKFQMNVSVASWKKPHGNCVTCWSRSFLPETRKSKGNHECTHIRKPVAIEMQLPLASKHWVSKVKVFRS